MLLPALSRCFALLVAGAVLTLAACGDASTTQTVAASAAKPARQEPLKIAFAYYGPIGDGGWTQAHDTARLKLQKELGSQIKTTFVEKVNSEQEAERVFKELVAQGNQLIFGTSFGHMKPMHRVADTAPQVKFEHAAGHMTSANMATYDSRTYEGAYLAGIVAGSMSTTGVIGVVASVPIPEVRRNISSFALGAQSVNPSVITRVIWINDWYNPALESQAATQLVQSGADILLQTTDSFAVLQTLERLGKRGFGWNSDMGLYGPTAHLGSVFIDWSAYYKKVTQDVLNKQWKGGTSWLGVRDGAIDLVSLASDIPADVRDRFKKAKVGLQNGTLTIWKGPIQDQSGKEVLQSGQTATDNFLRNMAFIVQGVEEMGTLKAQ